MSRIVEKVLNGELFRKKNAKRVRTMNEFQTKLHSKVLRRFSDRPRQGQSPFWDVRELGIDFGGLTAVDGFNLMIGRNEITGLNGSNGVVSPCSTR